jgi:hypothetical protein
MRLKPTGVFLCQGSDLDHSIVVRPVERPGKAQEGAQDDDGPEIRNQQDMQQRLGPRASACESSSLGRPWICSLRRVGLGAVTGLHNLACQA